MSGGTREVKEECYCRCANCALPFPTLSTSMRAMAEGDVALAGLTHWVLEHLSRLQRPAMVASVLMQRLQESTRQAMYADLLASFTKYDLGRTDASFASETNTNDPEDDVDNPAMRPVSQNDSGEDSGDSQGDLSGGAPARRTRKRRRESIGGDVMEMDIALPVPVVPRRRSAARRVVVPEYQPANPFAISGTAIDALPPEILVQVFSFLGPRRMYAVAGTCSAWRQLAHDVSLWHDQVVHPKAAHTPSSVARLLQSWPVRNLKLTSENHITQEGADAYSAATPLLRSLDIRPRGQRSCDEALEWFLVRCKTLDSLTLARCNGITLRPILNHTLTALKKLSVTHCNDLWGPAVRRIPLHCPNLELLFLPNHPVEHSDVELIVDKLENLSSLAVSVSMLQDCSIELLGKNATKLQMLALYSGEHVTDVSLFHIAKSCTNLKVLHLSAWRHATDNGYIAVVDACTALEELEITHCKNLTDRTVEVVGQRLHRLRELALPSCISITDAGIAHLGPRNCPRLSALHIGGCKALTNKSLEFIGSSCPELRQLFINKCSAFTDEGLAKLNNPLLTQLKAAQLMFSAEGFSQGLRVCSNLRGLVIDECPLVDDAALAIICARVPRLEKLHVQNCIRITDAGASATALALPRLKDFNISGCTSIHKFKLGQRRSDQ